MHKYVVPSSARNLAPSFDGVNSALSLSHGNRHKPLVPKRNLWKMRYVKYYKAIIIFLITLIFYQYGAFADDYYFDFKPVSRVPNSKNEYKINFLFISQDNFIVRPIMRDIQKQIFIKNGGAWVSGYENWTLLPYLEKTMDLKIQGAHEKSEVFFQIQNVNTGKLYLTPSKTLWPRNVVNEYLKKLNDSINSLVIISSELKNDKIS